MDKIRANKKSKPLSLFLIILLLVVFLSSCAKVSDTDADSADDGNDPCGNAPGNGSEIISGPSGPSGADNDSVFRSLTVDPTVFRVIYSAADISWWKSFNIERNSWQNKKENSYQAINMVLF
jgi:hypothetical protein